MKMVEGNSRPKIAPKRFKVEAIVEKEEGKDRISVLPDGLLIEILSRLPTTEIAIRTGTLSKRWKYLWTSVSTLIFKYYSFPLPFPLPLRYHSDFISFVDKALTQRPQSKLRKFAIDINYDVRIESQVSSWIRYAMSCNVEVLDVISYKFPLESDLLDEGFFTNSCFTDLKFSCCIFSPPGEISWKRLRSLRISAGNLGIDMIESILAGSPLLETLEWHDNYGNWQLGIKSKNIKKLVFHLRSHPCEFESQLNNVIRYAIILHGCIFNLDAEITWKKLRSFCLSNVDLDENMIENILSGSPMLETLEFYDCYGFKRLDITSKSVKELVFSRYGNADAEIEIVNVINAPNILSLTIRGYLYLLKLLLSTMPSLVEVNLDIEMFDSYNTTLNEEENRVLEKEVRLAEEEMLKGFIRSFCHVKELKIGNYYGKGTYKQAMLEKYRRSMLKEYKKAKLDSIFEEVHQLKETIQKMEHEREAEREQLKEKFQKIENEQAEREAERIVQEVERKAREVKMKEMEDKLKAFEELFHSRFSHPA